MAAFVFDTFTDTDSTLLVSGPHSPETGGAWGFGVSNTDADTFIHTNRCIGAGSAVTAFENATSPPSADYDVEASIFFLSTGSTFRAGVIGRGDRTNSDYYRAWYNGNTGNWELDKVISAAVTNLGTWADSPSASDTRTVRLKMTGTSIEVLVNGISRIGPVTDSAISAAGKAGFIIVQGSSSTGYAVDTFQAGLLVENGSPLFRGRSYPFFDDDEVNRFEFWPAVTVSANVTVTPTTASLTTSTFAPVLKERLTPSTASLSTTTFAPQANLGVTPSTASLTTATFAPSLALSLTPTTASLTTNTFAPTVTVGISVTPGTASLSTSTFAPSIPTSLTPTTATLTTATFAPTINIGVNVSPANATLTTSTFAPTVTATQNVNVTPDTASLATSTFAPTLHLSLTPSTVNLSTVTFAPTVSATANVTVVPDTLALVTTTFAPTIDAGGQIVVTPDPVNLTLTGYAPLISMFTGTGSSARTFIIEGHGILTVESDERISIVEEYSRISV